MSTTAFVGIGSSSTMGEEEGKMKGLVVEEHEQEQEPKAKKARRHKKTVRRGWEESLLNKHQRFGLADLFGYVTSSHSSSASSRSSPPQQPRTSDFFTLRLEHREGGAVAQHAGEERILMFRSDRPGAIAKIIYSSTPAPTAPAPASSSSGTQGEERSSCEQVVKKQEDGVDEERELSEMAQAKIHVLNIKESYRGHDLGSLLFTEAVASLQNRYMNEPSTRRQQQQQQKPCSSIRCQLDAEEDLRRHDKLVSFYKHLGCSIKPDAKIQFINNNDGETYRKVPMQRTLRYNNATTTTDNKNHNDEQKTDSTATTASSSSSSSLVLDRKNCPFIPISIVCGTCGCKQRGVNSSCLSSSSSASSSNQYNHHHSTCNGRVDWLLVEDGQGNVEFRTTQGRYLRSPSCEERHDVVEEETLPTSSSSWTEREAAAPLDRGKKEDCNDSWQQQQQQHSSDVSLGPKFHLLRVSDQPHSSGVVSYPGSDNDKNREQKEQHQEQQALMSKPSGKELWVLQSTSGGKFLTLDHKNHSLQYSKTPAFWQANTIYPENTNNNNNNNRNHNHVNSSSLVCTTDTPLRRRHYFYQWTKQTVDFCMSMRQRYVDGLRTRNKEMTLEHALLKVAKTIPAKSFRISDNETAPMKIQTSTSCTPTQRKSPPSLCARCFQNAQAFRRAGHPDWVQLLALLYCLASVIKCIDGDDDENDDDDDSYDWTIPSQTWVVGCAPPSAVIFCEFQSFNKDQQDSRYNSRQGIYPLHCGLDSVLLPWTGPEYMYHMLRHNKIAVPEEGMKMLRLASLYDWHTGHEYGHLANQDDLDAQPFVSDYGHLFQDAVRAQTCNTAADDDDDYVREALPSDEECDRLWKTYYSAIANKYNVGSVLCW